MAEIDTSIYRNIVQPNIDPMGRLYKLQEMQQQQKLQGLAIQKGTLDVQEAQREARRSEAISQAMRTSKTHEETVANLRALGVDTTKFEEAYATMNTAQLNQEIKKHELASVRAQDLSNTASQVLSAPETEQDTVYQRVRKPDWPEQRDPAFLHAMQTAKDFNELQKNMAQKAKDDLEVAGKTTANETARLTLANLQNRIAPPRAPVPGTDVPLSPEVEAQKLRLQKVTPGTDVPLPPDVEAQRTRLATTRAAAGVSADDPKIIAQAVIDGKEPPDLTGFYRNKAAIVAELAKQGYDRSTAERDWKAVQKHLSTLNGAQQERLRQAVSFTYDSLDNIEQLYNEWKQVAPVGVSGVKIFNRASLAVSKQHGGKAGEVAQNLEAQINDLTSELGTVYKGGNASTDETLRLAAENLKAEWNEQTFTRALQQIRKNLQIRRNSVQNSQPAGVSPGSPYNPQSGGTRSGAGGNDLAGKKDPLGIR